MTKKLQIKNGTEFAAISKYRITLRNLKSQNKVLNWVYHSEWKPGLIAWEMGKIIMMNNDNIAN